MNLRSSWNTQNPHIALREQLQNHTGKLSLSETCPDIDLWRIQLQTKLTELLGLNRFEAKTPVVQEVQWHELQGFSLTKILLETEPGFALTAWLGVPDYNEKQLPAVVCCHRDGPGKDELLGLTGYTSLLEISWALELTRQGYITLTPDARGWGENLGNAQGLHQAAMLMGQPLTGLHVWDALRCVDYLAQRPDVNAARIGIVGHEMGALTALFTGALSQQVWCTAACGALTTLTSQVITANAGEMPERLPQIPGLLEWADLPDVAALVFPRALLMTTAKTPGGQELAQQTLTRAEFLNEQVKLELETIPESQVFSLERVSSFCDDWLRI